MQDGWHSHAHSHIYHDDFELHLPSGRSVGHRSLARYYRQHLRDDPRAAVEHPRIQQTHADSDDDGDDEDEDGGRTGRAGGRRGAGGVRVVDGEGQEGGELALLNRRERREEQRAQVVAWRREALGMLGATASQKKDAAKLAKLSQAEQQRGRRKFERGVNRLANSQKHYRDPLLQ